ncbi:undecaprenyl-diphosphate phosphatase [Palleronia sp.]|uniref:undecaprenyl-diphosphate phosphatase n=1 Tax=Palleronia sp. TaxID=1940284 RepID=UPI0035C7FFAE
MPLLYLVIVAIVQGITEFLPISSSGHLVLLPALTGHVDQGLLIDVAAHVGTLAAVVLFFWADVRAAVAGIPSLLRGRIHDQGAWLTLCLIIATIPVIIAGLILKVTGLSDLMRSVALIGWTSIIFGILLWVLDQRGAEVRTAPEWTLKHALIMGMWQMLALVPGTSRSGITITGGRGLGYTRTDAARLSMLMSIPTIIASATLLSLDLISAPSEAVIRDAAVVAILSLLSALVALKLMFRLLKSVSFTPYVVYRLILGAGLLIWAYT